MTKFALLKTSQTTTPEYMTYRGGSARAMTINFIAVLVCHGDDSLLYDSGLGCEIDRQYGVDMPLWKRPLLRYGPVDPAKSQLEAAGFPLPRRIVLGHAHWDHASGLVDFPEAEVWTTRAEREFMRAPQARFSLQRGGTMDSQTGSSAIRWREFEFEERGFEMFERSLDLYGDGSVVLVPLPGHTPGSIGMFVTVSSGRRAFFCGDTVWNAKAIDDVRPKMFLARAMVDSDPAATERSIGRLRDLVKCDPALTIVPAHDGAVHDRLAYFPAFTE